MDAEQNGEGGRDGRDGRDGRMTGGCGVVYLDHNATTPLLPEVAEIMSRAALDYPGNPSSVHAWGRRARDAVERARAQVAHLLGASAEEIVFTSGGTEGDNLAIRGLAVAAAERGRRHLITSPIEHPAVLEAISAAIGEPGPTAGALSLLPVSGRGRIDLAALEMALREDTALVSLAAVNHELGNVYPVSRFAAVARGRGALMHTDAVQAAGKMPLDVTELGVDAATISAHKLGGPKGVGAVFVRRGLDLPPLARGGHQERERRPGTENVAGIVGFGLACQLAELSWRAAGERLELLRSQLLAGLAEIPNAHVLGCDDQSDGLSAGREHDRSSWPASAASTGRDTQRQGRLPGTVMVAFAGAPGQLVAIGLDLDDVCVSTGAACSSGSLEPSPVLRALGRSAEEAAEGVRISMGWTTTSSDIARFNRLLPEIVARVRAAVAGRLAGDEFPRQSAALNTNPFTAALATSARGV